MEKFASFVVKKKFWFLVGFAIVVIACAICIPFVKINYDDTQYLPKDSATRRGLTIMESEFGANGSASIMIDGKSFEELYLLKNQISALPGVLQAVWADDVFSELVKKPVRELNDEGVDFTTTQAIEYLVRFADALPPSENINALSVGAVILTTFKGEESAIFMAFLQKLAPGDIDLSGGTFTPEIVQYLSVLKTQTASFYAKGAALMQVLFEEDDYASSTQTAMRSILALDSGMRAIGNSALVFLGQQMQTNQILICTIAVVVIALVILFLMSASYFEPILYILAIGVAIVINLGSNIIFGGGISYITNSVSVILQLALSIDYSIFLLARFKKERDAGHDCEKAMIRAVAKSLSPVSASSLTTIASFVALMFMKYKMGLDMGLVMGKGIIVSLLSVFLFLPGIIVYTHKLLEKSKHKTFKLECKKLSRGLFKGRFIIPILALCVVIPFAYFSYQNTYEYGVEASQGGEGSTYVTYKAEVEAKFGRQNTLALLVPKDAEKELRLSLALERMLDEGILSVQSLGILQNTGFAEYMPDGFDAQFMGEHYQRVILNLSVSEEGDETFALLVSIDNLLADTYGLDAEYYLLGNSAAALDTRNITDMDYTFISIIALLLVGIVILFTYRNPFLPLLLLAVIQSGIWINMAFPYFMGDKIVFLGYMIICNILLGATIDYAILMTANYLENRKTMDKHEAMSTSLGHSLRALFTSAGIFTVGGLAIGFFMQIPTVQMLGYSIMRGGIASFIMVIFVLPTLLILCDKWIKPLNFKKLFHRKKKVPEDKTT